MVFTITSCTLKCHGLSTHTLYAKICLVSITSRWWLWLNWQGLTVCVPAVVCGTECQTCQFALVATPCCFFYNLLYMVLLSTIKHICIRQGCTSLCLCHKQLIPNCHIYSLLVHSNMLAYCGIYVFLVNMLAWSQVWWGQSEVYIAISISKED